MQPTKQYLDKINQYSRRELSAEEVFVFEIRLCDTNIDKDYEKFNIDSLYKLADLYIGKTGVFDSGNQNNSARIFETCVHEFWGGGDGYLNALAYMVRCDKNKDLILEIDSGIKKEVSIGCAIEKVICSICEEDVKYGKCEHNKGEKYFGETCYHILKNPTDAYEWSFIAVPTMKTQNNINKLSNNNNFKLNYDSAFNAPIILNESPIGIVKHYNKSGFIECILWDKFIEVEASFNENEDGIINALVIKT